MSELLKRYLVGYEDWNSIDGIASEMRDQAEELPCTLKGFRRLIEHPASYEMDADVGVVISLAQFDLLSERNTPADERLIEKLIMEWRALLEDDVERGIKQRALYALVRIEGPDCPEALRGLESKRAFEQEAVLCALTDPMATGERFDEVLPDTLTRAIVGLCKNGPGIGKARGGSTHFEVPLIYAALRLADSTKAIRAAIDNDALAAHLPAILDAGIAAGGEALATLLEQDFEAAVQVLQQGRDAGLPHRGAMAKAGLIARLVGTHSAMALRATEVLDLLPGLHLGLPSPAPLRPGATPAMHPVLSGFVTLLGKCMDQLELAPLERIATHLNSSHAPFFACAASAWAHLPAEQAGELIEGLASDGTVLLGQRLEALASALLAMSDKPKEHIAMLQRFASSGAGGENMHCLLKDVGVDPKEVVEMARKARSPSELMAALELASTHSLGEALRPVLKRLREAPFRLTEEVEALLTTLVNEDNVAFIDDEIDGENPFRDRREALGRVLEASGL